jgi:hypothetical protein
MEKSLKNTNKDNDITDINISSELIEEFKLFINNTTLTEVDKITLYQYINRIVRQNFVRELVRTKNKIGY